MNIILILINNQNLIIFEIVIIIKIIINNYELLYILPSIRLNEYRAFLF